MAKSLLKWLTPVWVAASLAVIGWQLFLHRDAIVATPVSGWALLLSLAATLAGKLFAALQVRISLSQAHADVSQPACFYCYSMADLAKYLPGGIWGIVGRIGFYRSLRLGAGTIGRALVLEQVWLVGGALAVGLALFAFGRGDAGAQILAVVGAAGWLVILMLSGTATGGRRVGLSTATKVTLCQLGLWLATGAGFAVLLPSDHLSGAGIFAIAFAAGLMVPFAPSGIGVREAVVAALALPSLPVEVVLQAMVLSRAVWIAADLAFACTVAWSCRAGWKKAVALGTEAG